MCKTYEIVINNRKIQKCICIAKALKNNDISDFYKIFSKIFSKKCLFY